MAEGKKKMEAKPIVVTTEVKQTQKVLDLNSGNDADITVVQNRYSVRDYDETIDGSPEEFEKATMRAVAELVQPRSEQIKAFLNYATSQSYQEGKKAALSGGNFLTQELKSRIVGTMRQMPKWAETSAKDCFDSWKSAYLSKQPGAIKLLQTVQAADEFDF